VHHSPKLSIFTDDNGVGKDRVDIYDTDNPATWGGGSLNDHIPAQIQLGMDGYFYMSVGDKGVFGIVSNIDKSTAELRGGGVIRFRPDGTQFEVYARGTRNHLDISMNAEDEMFSYDNTDDGLGWNTRFTHLVDGGFYGYPYDYRAQESDAEGMARMKTAREAVAKARADYDKAIKDAKTDEEKAKIVKPSNLVGPFQPYTLWAMEDYGGGSPCGAIAYNEDALPEEYRGNLFHSEWGKKALERFIVERKGATYRVVSRDDKFLKGGTQPFRPLGVCISPDGMSFYICDWNFDGWNNKTDAGRLLRLSYTGPSQAKAKPSWYVPAAMGQKFDATTAQLVEGLLHPAQSVRQVAQRRIAERGNQAVATLVAMVNDAKAPAYARWSAIWTLDRIDDGKAGRAAVIGLLTNPNVTTSVRMQAARQLGTRKAKEATAALIASLNDPDAAMRFRAATALGRIGEASTASALVAKLGETDLFARYAMFTALNRIGRQSPSAWKTIVKALSSESEQVRTYAACALRETVDPQLVNELCAYIGDTKNPATGRAMAVTAIAPLYKQPKPWNGRWWGTQPQRGNRPALEVDWSGTSEAQATIRKALDTTGAVRAAAIGALVIAPDPTVGDKLAALFKSETDVKVRRTILKALGASKSPAAGALAVEILKNTKQYPDLGADAMALAASLGGQQMIDALTTLLASDANADLLVSACETLGKIKDAKAVPALAARVNDKNEKLAAAAVNALGQITVAQAFDALLSSIDDKRVTIRKAVLGAIANHKNPKAIEPLLKVYKEPAIYKEALLALAASPKLVALDAYLDGLNSSDAMLRSTCRRAIQNFQKEALPVIEQRLDTNPLSTTVVAELQNMYQRFIPENERKTKLWQYDTKKLSPDAFANYAKANTGSVDNGRKLFKSDALSCIKCHKVGNEGGDVGPALTGVGVKYDRAFLIDAVLFPSKQILDGYHQTIVRLKDGDVQSGVLKIENEKEITLFDASAQPIVIAKSDIKEREHGKLSVMPEGLHTTLKPEEFADLIAYLESLKDANKK
jgi:putative heme-binding domain-containing protein